MDDLDFNGVLGVDANCRAIDRLNHATIRHKQIAEAVEAFDQNARRVIYCILMPGTLFELTRTFQRHLDEGYLQFGGSLDPMAPEHPLHPKLDEFLAARADECTTWSFPGNPVPDDDVLSNINEWVDFFSTDPAIRCGLHALLTGFVTGIWTAVEVLAGDLWEAALNVRPDEFAALSGQRPGAVKPPKKPFSAFPPGDDGDRSVGKLVRLDYLCCHGYDLSRRMGTVLRERFNFQTVDGIRDAYVQAFDETHPRIRDSVLHPCHIALAASRNVLAHRAGVVDKDFLADWKRCPRLQELFPNAESGTRLPITGRIVGELIFPAIEHSVHLIEAVVAAVDGVEGEKWISTVLLCRNLSRRVRPAKAGAGPPTIMGGATFVRRATGPAQSRPNSASGYGRSSVAAYPATGLVGRIGRLVGKAGPVGKAPEIDKFRISFHGDGQPAHYENRTCAPWQP